MGGQPVKELQNVGGFFCMWLFHFHFWWGFHYET